MRGELQALHFSPSFFVEQLPPWREKDAVDLFWPCVLSLQLRRMHARHQGQPTVCRPLPRIGDRRWSARSLADRAGRGLKIPFARR
jgi:hypothetical protein